MIAKIVVDSPSKRLDHFFDYLVPEALADGLTIGSRVIVPFAAGNREVEGFCMGFAENSESKNLKEIIKTANDIPGFDSDMAEIIEWMHDKYLTSYIDIIHTVIPAGTAMKSREWIIVNDRGKETTPFRTQMLDILKDNGGGMEYGTLCGFFKTDISNHIRSMINEGILRKEYRQSAKIRDKKIRYVRLAVSKETALEQARELEKKASLQSKMLSELCRNEYLTSVMLQKKSGGSASTISALVKKGLAEIFELSELRDPYKDREFEKTEKMAPTEEQRTAINKITAAVQNGGSEVFLLHGVTGSGKTEVFMQVIEYALSIGKKAIMLVPEISLTPQMVQRFMSRFQSKIAIMHSGLSQGERYDQWKRIKDGEADIVIGARSAVFAPVGNIGVIIMDEEHSDTYKSDIQPRYNAREIAQERIKQYGGALVLASATPSVESYYKAQNGEYTLLEMNTRYNKNKMPDIFITDMRSELSRGNKSMLSGRLYKEIEKNLENGEQTILFMNRRGFSTFVSCRTCGYVPQCPNCNISLTYHRFENALKCHYCGYSRPSCTICPECGSKYIRYFGGGTQKVEHEIHRLFPKASTIRMDMDTTSRKQSHEKILEKFEKEKTDILIGTQMVAKGLDFENVTLVGVIAADTMLYINDYRSSERTFAMLEQVSGRAGRGEKEGRAVIQTYTPEHEAICLVKTHDYKSFYKSEIAERRVMWYPPFCKMISVLFQGSDEALTVGAAKEFVREIGDIKRFPQKIQVLGPIPSHISKIKNKYRWQIIFKCENEDTLGEKLYEAEIKCRENKKNSQISIVIDKSPGMIY